ncbi:DHA2 family efflux MFS transporter permease subunit [Paractinoplanes globisporus]|uniref:DHA2 family efflux MFS transporter permease subunit n=1 Tax=Paractinoplanes globisporus TaxID=113565 RepID=A0ABW6WUR9_9ACTN|nr:DHA2 family efflux MFS transporter permease subunit [Actinoplanes globisporus]
MTAAAETSTVERATGISGGPHPQRWVALGVIAIAQLMVVLDATIVNIALPSAQKALDISDADRQWVVTAYTLAFGGLLLLGGRIADYWGRKRTFMVGAIGFAAASALGGLATSGAMLFAARALQGAFGALLAPASLALLTVLFTEARERAKAFAVYGAIAGGGSAVGLLLGGVLTEYANWRWCLLVNIPVALVALALAIPLVPESRAHGETSYDVPGAIVVTLGLASLVYGFTEAAKPAEGWGSPTTLAFIGGGLALLVVFVIIQARVRNPLLPLRIVADRNRGGAYITSALVGAGLLGAFLFLILYLQNVLGYTPLKAGLAALPVTVGVLISAGVASNLLPRIGAKPLMIVGPILAAGAMFSLRFIGLDTSFWVHLMPAELFLGLGLGFTFVPLSSLALVGVPEHDAGAASAALNATQQVGGSLGTALLNTIATSAITAYAVAHLPSATSPQDGQKIGLLAQIDGYSSAFTWASVMLLAAAVVAAVLIQVRKEDLPVDGAVAHAG